MDKNKVISLSEEDAELYKDKIKVFVAEPTNGLIDYRAHDNRLDFYMHLARLEATTNYKFFTGNVGRLFISYAREIISERALEGGMDYILWIDDDMMLPYNTFENLVSHDVDIVTPLAFQRVPPYKPVMWRDVVVNNELNFEQIESYPADDLMEVPQIGFGVVLMKTSVLKRVPKPWFMNGGNIGEDIGFCYKANQYGIKCHVDTSFCVGHIGHSPIITETEYREFKEHGHIKLDKRPIDFTSKGVANG